jgi:S-formylglutathione hydrolase FrmB
MNITHTSLLHGWLPATVAVVAWGCLVFGVAWWRRSATSWAAIGAASLGVVLFVQWAFDMPARVGGTYPQSFAVWIALPLFALAAAASQWRRSAWWRRVVTLFAVPTLLAFGGLQINAHYAYLPTIGDLVGAPLPGQVAAQLLHRHHKHGDRSAIPKNGLVARIDIPAVVSGFQHRRAFIWVPPAFFETPQPHLPVLMLLAGVPGDPGDWLRGGRALDTANAWAREHGGVAPLIVAADQNGYGFGDTECVNGTRGEAETYLTVDVPRFMHTHFGAPLDRHHWAVAGLSEGGTCALELASVHPDQFATFGDFSGDSTPLLRDPANTVTKLFGGSEQAWLAHEPERWFGRDATDGVQGVITVGSKDTGHIAEEQAVESAALRNHMDVRLDVIPGGGHDFRTWAKSLRMNFAWIVGRLFATSTDRGPARGQYNQRSAHHRRPFGTHRSVTAFDKGVRGFDLGDRGGRSEPTSPDRRERAGTTNTRQ